MEQQDKWWTPETVAVVTGGESCLLDFDRRRHFRTQRTPPLPARYTHNTTNNTIKLKSANKGIGREIARLLAEAGLTVVMTARDGEGEEGLS